MSEFFDPADDRKEYFGASIATPRTTILNQYVAPRYMQVLAETALEGMLQSDGTRTNVSSGLDYDSIYTGKGGLGLALLHVAPFLCNFFREYSSGRSGADVQGTTRFNESLCKELCQKHLPPSVIAKSILMPLRLLSPSDHHPLSSFYFGEVGLASICAVSGGEGEKPKEGSSTSIQSVERLIKIALVNNPADEVLFGYSGLLYCVSYLREYGHTSTTLEKQARSIVARLLATGSRIAQTPQSCDSPSNDRTIPTTYRLSGWPLMWEWNGKPYLGAAHGVAGICYNLLPYLRFMSAKEAHLLRGTIEKLVAVVEATGYRQLPTKAVASTTSVPTAVSHHWCHGLPGLIPLLTFASQAFGEIEFLRAAERCGDTVWQEGLLRKGLGLCHGVFGNAYAFLNLYRTTNNQRYLHWAHEFVRISAGESYKASVQSYQDPQRKVQGVPDAPTSLMEGVAGELCFLVDLLRPEKSYFPGFEFPNNGLRSLIEIHGATFNPNPKALTFAVPGQAKTGCIVHHPLGGACCDIATGYGGALSPSHVPAGPDRRIIHECSSPMWTILPGLLDPSFCGAMVRAVVDDVEKSQALAIKESGVVGVLRIETPPTNTKSEKGADASVTTRSLFRDLFIEKVPDEMEVHCKIGERYQSSFHVDQVKYAPLLRELVGMAQVVCEDSLLQPLVAAVNVGGGGDKAAAAAAAPPEEKEPPTVWEWAAHKETVVCPAPRTSDKMQIPSLMSRRERTRLRMARDMEFHHRPLRLRHAYCIQYTKGGLESLRAHTDPCDVTLNICLRRRNVQGGELQLDDTVEYTHIVGDGILLFGDTLHQVLPLHQSCVNDASRVQLVLLLDFMPPHLGGVEGEAMVESVYVASGKPVPALNLADDVLGVVLGFMELDDLARTMRTCSRLHHLAQGNDLWQERYQSNLVLENFFPADGFRHVPPSCGVCSRSLVAKHLADRHRYSKDATQFPTIGTCRSCGKCYHWECGVSSWECASCNAKYAGSSWPKSLEADTAALYAFRIPLLFDADIGPTGTFAPSPTSGPIRELGLEERSWEGSVINSESGLMKGPWKERVRLGLMMAKKYGESRLMRQEHVNEGSMYTSTDSSMYTGSF